MVDAPEWPERLTLRDTKVYADEGQRIFTTATGYGYEKREYIRADRIAQLERENASLIETVTRKVNEKIEAERDLAEARAELARIQAQAVALFWAVPAEALVGDVRALKAKAETLLAAEAERDRLAADNAQLREALTPFAGDKLPTAKRTKIDYNRWGLRCAISPLELARDRARASLQTGEQQG